MQTEHSHSPTSNSSVLISARSPREALAGLVEVKRAARPNLSVAGICRNIGIPSRGYFADLLGGRRRLTRRYFEDIVRAFALTQLERDTFGALISVEEARTPEAIASASAKAAELKVRLSIQADYSGMSLDTNPLRRSK